MAAPSSTAAFTAVSPAGLPYQWYHCNQCDCIFDTTADFREHWSYCNNLQLRGVLQLSKYREGSYWNRRNWGDIPQNRCSCALSLGDRSDSPCLRILKAKWGRPQFSRVFDSGCSYERHRLLREAVYERQVAAENLQRAVAEHQAAAARQAHWQAQLDSSSDDQSSDSDSDVPANTALLPQFRSRRTQQQRDTGSERLL